MRVVFSEFDSVTVHGTGRFGSVSECRGLLTIVYFETQQEAEASKASIDRIGCGHRCTRHHDLWLPLDEMVAGATSSRRESGPRESTVKEASHPF